ncbi:MAG: methyltransferase domain-containing protein [Myxococcales bacterium]|nr:methyltransferase domain-containing protein [Myxococcales bacterium]
MSWFRRGDAVYAWHDLYGFLLEMSLDLKAFVDAFAPPATPQQAAQRCGLASPMTTLAQFAQTFAAHRILVAPATDERAAVLDGYPIRGPWIVVHHVEPDRAVAYVSRGFGPEPWAQPRAEELAGADLTLWRNLDGERSARELAELVAVQTPMDRTTARRHVLATLARWTHPDHQLARLLLRPHSALRTLPAYATSTMPYAPFDQPADAAATPQGGARDLTDYHSFSIADAELQFEELETTMSHLFADPHPALRHRTWAAALVDAAVARGWLRPGHATSVEVGGGTGRFAEGWVRALRDRHPHLEPDAACTVIELSPVLHAAQARRLTPWGPRFRSTLGHAEALALPDASVDLLVCNEVIADLRLGLIDPELLAGDADALADVRRYGLDLAGAANPVAIQVGAARLIEQLARVLRPGGVAVLTEFGAERQTPIESTHLDHAEWSVHFGHLIQVARCLGLGAHLEPVAALVGLDGAVPVLATTRTQFRNLRALLAAHGIALPKRAMTPPEFRARCRDRIDVAAIEGLHWTPAGERVMGLRPPEFLALVVTRPDPAADSTSRAGVLP